MSREIVVDTETTGLDRKVDRIIEIGCVEMIDLRLTGNSWHKYINPLHPVSKGAFKVHGLGNDFLKKHPTFRRQVNSFLTFIEGATLVAHNAPFDIGMINAELDRLDLPPLENEVIDTLALSRDLHPGKRHTLDSLCKFYKIDNSKRVKHGALLDAEILAEVYVELRGGRQFGMSLDVPQQAEVVAAPVRQRPTPLNRTISDAEREAHEAFIKTLGENAIWLQYRSNPLTDAA